MVSNLKFILFLLLIISFQAFSQEKREKDGAFKNYNDTTEIAIPNFKIHKGFYKTFDDLKNGKVMSGIDFSVKRQLGTTEVLLKFEKKSDANIIRKDTFYAVSDGHSLYVNPIIADKLNHAFTVNKFYTVNYIGRYIYYEIKGVVIGLLSAIASNNGAYVVNINGKKGISYALNRETILKIIGSDKQLKNEVLGKKRIALKECKEILKRYCEKNVKEIREIAK